MIKILKHTVIILSIIILAMSSLICTYAIEFIDIDINSEDASCIKKMVDAGIVNGYPDGNFKPYDKIKRRDAIKIINKTFGFTTKTVSVDFSDIKNTDWYYDELLIAVGNNYIEGYLDKTFRPENQITREQFCKILCTVLDIHSLDMTVKISDSVSDWAKPFVQSIAALYIMPLEENNTFRAKESITRLEVCQALSAYVKNQSQSDITEIDDTENNNIVDDASDNDDEDIIECLKRVSSILCNQCISELKDEQEIEICNDIYINMVNYIKDNNYNYKKAANLAYEKYKKITTEQKEKLKESILKFNTLDDLIKLKDWFFPDVSI